jgi:hypothetical protein
MTRFVERCQWFRLALQLWETLLSEPKQAL